MQQIFLASHLIDRGLTNNHTVQQGPFMKDMNAEQLENLLKLRLAVASIGEKAQWWPSQICTPLRLKVLESLFPKTWRLAAFSAVSEAAKLVHREALANRAHHLFRFQTEIEQDLRRFLSKAEGQAIFDTVLAQSPEETLRSLAQKGNRSHIGAIELGEATPETIYRSIGKMASLYLSAYTNHTKSFPYFLPVAEHS